MLEKLFYKIGLNFAKLRFRKDKFVPQHFTFFMQDCNNILIILPDDAKQFDECVPAIINLSNIWEGKKITLLAKDQYSPIIELREYFYTIGITKEDSNRFFLPKRRLIKEIRTSFFDLVIDLNASFHLASSYLSAKMDTRYKIGFNHEFSDYFYNFQFTPKDNNFKAAYSNFFNNLSMFGIKGEVENEIQT